MYLNKLPLGHTLDDQKQYIHIIILYHIVNVRVVVNKQYRRYKEH